MLKTLLKSVREYRRSTFLTPVFVGLEVAGEIIIPLQMANLIDFGIGKGDMNSVLKYGLLLLLAAAVQFLFGTLSGISAARASVGFGANLRSDMYKNVQSFSFANIDKFSTASIVTRLTTDITNVQMAYQMLTRMAFRGPLMLIFALVVSFGINAQISMIFLICIPILSLCIGLIMSKAHPIFRSVFKTYDKLNAVVEENLRAMRVVKSFNREEYEKEKFEKISSSIYKQFVKAEKLITLNMPLMQLCMYTCMLLISWFGARAIIASGSSPNPELTAGQLISLISYAMQILMSLMMLSMVFVMITMARSSAERIVEILNEKPDITSAQNAVSQVKDGSVVFDNVSFSYGEKNEKPVLEKVSLSIPSGAVVGILGATGSAKSSLVQLIPRLYDASSGSVFVGGINVKSYDLSVLRDAVSVVLQKNVLFSGSIKDNLYWGDKNATDDELFEVCRIAQADNFIRALPNGYNSHIEQGGSNVSGGQKQRLCIARALLKKPKILILDDSTSAVDTATDARIQSALAKYIPQTTKIIIAQRVSSVQHADMIIVMNNGSIAATGTHEELLNSCGIYQEVYQSQQKGGDADE